MDLPNRFARKARAAATCLGFAALACASLPAQAQNAYRCAGPNGQVQWSDRPCSLQGKLGGYGPAPEPLSRSGTAVRYSASSEPPPYYEYLGPECRSLNDAMRTASSRGVGADVQRDLHRDWQRKCAEDQAEATRAYRDAQQQRNEKRQIEKAQAQAQVQQTKLQREQCDEMLRILAVKRKRSDLTEGERKDLMRFEDNYRSRCS